MDLLDRDKNLKADRKEDPGSGPLPQKTPGDEMETDSSEESWNFDETDEFTAADWKKQFPDYSAEEFEEKLPDRGRERWMAPVANWIFGTLLGAAIAGVIVNGVPGPRQASMFFVYFLVLAPVLSYTCHWLFYLRPERLQKKTEMSHPQNPYGSDPIHPK